jgi:hypothetical protein
MARKTPLNYLRLSAALNQHGPWHGKGIVTDKAWFVDEIKRRIEAADWTRAREDVSPFIPRNEQRTLESWGPDLFLSALDWLP